MTRLRRSAMVFGAAALGVLGLGFGAGDQAFAARSGVSSTYVLMGEDGARIARAVTQDDHCPSIRIDGRASVMTQRAGKVTEPLRPTRSDPSASRPSVFDTLVCEAAVPTSAQRAEVAGRVLPLPPPVIERIVVIGDTGCRIKLADHAFQACNDSKAYPFAQVAAAAARWRPQLVLHVGDYLYRENPCPADQAGCAGSPWGYGDDAWRADFLEPADPLLKAAAWAAVRGNHESCARAGQDWWRLLDPRPLVAGRDCNDAAHDDEGDYSDPFAVPLGQGAQLVLFDSSNTPAGAVKPDDVRWARYRDTYAKIEALTHKAPHTLLADHHPILAFSASQAKTGEITLRPGNGGLQSTFGSVNPGFVPAGVDLLLSGHVHVWEALSFSSAHPAQIVAGFSGTQEDIVPLPAAPAPGATPAPGAVVAAMSSWVDGFGFMTLTRTGADQWLAEVRDGDGKVVNTCRIQGSKLACDKVQVPHA